MSSKAILIRDAVVALLQTPALTGIGSGGVSVDPDYAYESGDLPAVAVYLGDEQTSNRNTIGKMQRQLAVNVRIISKGDDAFSNADALMVQVHSRIAADVTLGGKSLDLLHQATRRSRDVLQVPVAVTDLEYLVDYTTSETSLES